MTQKIIPHLWFDKGAREAGELYTSIFAGSSVESTVSLENTPSGTVDIVTLSLAGQQFVLLSAGPMFKFTPAISFLVSCGTKGEVHGLWENLSAGGSALMELDSYPWSERYGWAQDRFGVSWQIVPTAMKRMLERGTREQVTRVTEAFLQMKKFDVAKLEEVYAGS